MFISYKSAVAATGNEGFRVSDCKMKNDSFPDCGASKKPKGLFGATRTEHSESLCAAHYHPSI